MKQYKRMTKDRFYDRWPMNEMMVRPKEQHLVSKLKDSGFSWKQIDSILTLMDQGSYSELWNIRKSKATNGVDNE